ncbi:hypothetical protein ABID56_001553 [Alkalibacillus flavidus]|uniref:Uncharacterized protein n=1 Tax=Alkalibacillus flavidus TaxID=546021 RepID=A0ABV2KV60_9BACI
MKIREAETFTSIGHFLYQLLSLLFWSSYQIFIG